MSKQCTSFNCLFSALSHSAVMNENTVILRFFLISTACFDWSSENHEQQQPKVRTNETNEAIPSPEVMCFLGF